jgi:S1-C subfamily serine protease
VRFHVLRLSAAFALAFLLAACGCVGLPSAREVRSTTQSTVLIGVRERGYKYSKASDGGTDITKTEKSWSGTGVVVGRSEDGASTFVLTAGHVAHAVEAEVHADERPPSFDLFFETRYRVSDLRGTLCEATFVRESADPDLGLLVTASGCKIGVPIAYKADEPEYGSLVTVVGCPSHSCEMGHAFFVSDGRWLGTSPEHVSMTSAAAWSGNSGSPVVQDGKLVGLVYAVDDGFHDISFAVPIPQILEFANPSGARDGG